MYNRFAHLIFFISYLLLFKFSSHASLSDIDSESSEDTLISSQIHNLNLESDIIRFLIDKASETINISELSSEFDPNKLKDFIKENFTFVENFSQKEIEELEKIGKLVFNKANNLIGTIYYTIEDHSNILLTIIKNKENYFFKHEDYNSLVYQYYLIYGSMFPSIYESDQIKDILDEYNYLNVAVESLQNIDDDELENLCFSITDLFETNFVYKYYYENPLDTHKSWISFFNLIRKVPSLERSKLICFLSCLPYELNYENPLVTLELFLNDKDFLKIILNLNNFDILKNLDIDLNIQNIEDFKQEIIKLNSLEKLEKIDKNKPSEKIDYDLIRCGLLKFKKEHNLNQHNLALELDVSDSLLSLFLRGKIDKSPTIFKKIKNSSNEKISKIIQR